MYSILKNFERKEYKQTRENKVHKDVLSISILQGKKVQKTDTEKITF